MYYSDDDDENIKLRYYFSFWNIIINLKITIFYFSYLCIYFLFPIRFYVP